MLYQTLFGGAYRHGNAICYSGYREGQSPVTGVYPSKSEIKQDLEILTHNWQYIRLYDCGPHADLVLSSIKENGFPLLVMLGVDMAAEMSNPNCPWGADFDQQTLDKNEQRNAQQVKRLIELCQQYPEIIFSVSVGNEATVDWNDHMVSVESLINYVKEVKKSIPQPITFCENYVPWTNKLDALGEELDFISVHTYPVWEYQTIDQALDYTKSNYYSVKQRYPDKPVIITEAGWATASNGRGIEPWNANQDLQKAYYQQLLDWSNQEQIMTFVFEAFDEPWKGSDDPLEPEKHWGLFYLDRSPKLVMEEVFAAQVSVSS
jgi:exo-beta-1,3-glucanase (GH17 family)